MGDDTPRPQHSVGSGVNATQPVHGGTDIMTQCALQNVDAFFRGTVTNLAHFVVVGAEVLHIGKVGQAERWWRFTVLSVGRLVLCPNKSFNH